MGVRLGWRGVANWQREGEEKAAALAGRAVHLQFTPHQCHQLLTDAQAQAGAAKPPCGGRLGLGEAFKNAGLVFWRNTNARVTHTEAQGHGVRLLLGDLHRQHDLAFFCEFDCVAAQVEQHLLKPHAIADQRGGQRTRDVKQDFDRLVAHAAGQDDGQVVEHLLQVKRQGVKRHFSGVYF